MEGYRSAMKAIVCEQFGPVSDLRLVERESAAVGPGDVRVAVTACGVNYVDGLFVQGKYQIKPPVPFVPGMEVVGRVVEIGSDVSTRSIDDRVFVNVGLGGYVSEVVVAEARSVLLLTRSPTDKQRRSRRATSLDGLHFVNARRCRADKVSWCSEREVASALRP